MVWREGRVGCSLHHLGWPSLSPFGLVGIGPGYLFNSQVTWGWLLFTPHPPTSQAGSGWLWPASCRWPVREGKCEVEGRLLLCPCRVA